MRGEGEHIGCWSSRLPISRTFVVKDDIVDMDNEAHYLFLTRMSDDGVGGRSIISWGDLESSVIMFFVCTRLWWSTTRDG